jgi:hypothetical protein
MRMVIIISIPKYEKFMQVTADEVSPYIFNRKDDKINSDILFSSSSQPPTRIKVANERDKRNFCHLIKNGNSKDYGAGRTRKKFSAAASRN